MKITCGSCGKAHKSTSKLESSIEQLLPGQKIRIKCSQCGQAIALSREDLYQSPTTGTIDIKPPPAPDTSWLRDGYFDDDEIVSDIPQAIILMKEGEGRDKVAGSLTGLGYRSETVENSREVVGKMPFNNYSCVILHTGSLSGSFVDDPLHKYMRTLDMDRRRYILYVLIGPEFQTFYNMQALSHSANLVVNDGDLQHFGVILRRAIPEYEELFGPYMDELKIQGK